MAGSFMVGVSVLVENGEDVLLLHRAKSKDYGAGEWEPVSGRVESGENAEQAAIREVMEETGLAVDQLQVFDTFAFVRTGNKELIGITFCGKVNSRDVVLSEEHDAFQWTHVSKLESVETNHGVALSLAKYVRRQK